MGPALACGGLVLVVGLVARHRPVRRRRSGLAFRWTGSLPLHRQAHRRPGGEPISLLQLRTAVAHGASLVQAFDAVAVGGGEWADGASRLRNRVRAGAGLQPALDQWAAEDPDPSVALVADALAVAASSGGSLVRAIDAVVDAARERVALRREVRALASQARASAAVLVVMPVLFALAVAVLDPRIRGFFLGTVGGPACVALGVALDGAGSWWMLRLVRRVG